MECWAGRQYLSKLTVVAGESGITDAGAVRVAIPKSVLRDVVDQCPERFRPGGRLLDPDLRGGQEGHHDL